MTPPDEPYPIPGLPPSVAGRIVTELGGADGGRVLRCLRTANSLLGQSDIEDLRLAESAAYNLREALDSVVRDRPAGEGGFSAAVCAWERYKVTIALPGADEIAARAELAAAMDGLAEDKERQAFMTRKLLAWFQEQTGVAPIPGTEDPSRQYNELRERAARILHRDASYGEVQALFTAIVSWFVRLFTPPSDLMSKIEQLARLAYSPEHLTKFRSMALTAHHLRLFLERLNDPSWLDPLKDVGLIALPQPGESWPVSALTGTTRRLPDDRVRDLLMDLLTDVKSLPKANRSASAFEILRTASWLGPSGLPIVLEVLRQYPTDNWTQTLAIADTKDLDPADAVHLEIADAVIGNEDRHDRGHHTSTMLNRLALGLTAANVEERLGLLIHKLRRLAADDSARYIVIDITALSLDDDDDGFAEPMLLVAQSLAQVIPVARGLGLAGSQLLQEVRSIPGEVGDRMVCQVLAGATDIDRHTKMTHLQMRLASETATGDDDALIDDLSPFTEDEIDQLRGAIGQPTLLDLDQPDSTYGSNWPRGWRWAMVLPQPILVGWEAAIDAVSMVHGAPDRSALSRRIPRSMGGTGSSPITSEALAKMDVTAAAASVAGWRPSADDPWGVSARELARSLETAVKGNAERWTEDPTAIVRALREPVYVDHYFRGLTSAAPAVAARAPALIKALVVTREERWEPTILGSDTYDYEPDWSVVDTVSIELIDALADADADLAGDLDFCWGLAIGAAMTLPEDIGAADQYDDAEHFGDPLTHAINSAYGKGLQAAIALGGWEHRNRGSASDRLSQVLTRSLSVEGAVGAQLRSIVAGSRPFVEGIASDWLAHNQERLFGDALGRVTFDQTLKYSRPTKAFYEHSLTRLLDASRRGAEHAVAWLLIAHLWDEPNYTFDAIISGLTGHVAALAEACREVARLSKGLPQDQAHTAERGVAFWDRVLAEPRDRVPASSLCSLGYWAMATEIDETRWLDLMEATIRITEGKLDLASQVAERCRDAQPSPAGLRILAALLGHGEIWEQHHVDSIAVEAVRAAMGLGLEDEAVEQLRERLIQRGRHDVGPTDQTDGA